MEIWAKHEKRLAALLARGAGRLAAAIASVDGGRRTIDWLQDEFFIGMTTELEARGVPTRVASTMLGVSRRTFLRRRNAAESRLGEVGSSLWWNINDFVGITRRDRAEIMRQFSRYSPEIIASILNDMLESGWLVHANDTFETTAEAGWDDARLDAYVASRIAAHGATLDELTSETGLSEDRVSSSLERVTERAHGPGYRSQGLARWRLMYAFADAALSGLHRAVQGSANDELAVWTLTYDAEHQPAADELEATFDEALAVMNERYVEVAEPMIDGTRGARRSVYGMVQMHGGEWIDG